MKKIVTVVSMLVLLSAWPLARSGRRVLAPAQTGGAVEQALLDLERKWVAAGQKNDAAALGEILAEGWSTVSADGKVITRAKTLEDVKKSKFTRSEVSDMRVRVINADTAVVTGVWTGVGTDADGKKVDTSERWTDVFAKQGATWKCVASHNTTIKK